MNPTEQPQRPEDHALTPSADLTLAGERRMTVRYAVDTSAICRPGVIRQERSWSVRVLDVSTSGVRLVSPRRFEPGTLLGLDLDATGEGRGRLLLARVVRLGRDDSGAWLLGCAFIAGLTDEEVRDLVGG